MDSNHWSRRENGVAFLRLPDRTPTPSPVQLSIDVGRGRINTSSNPGGNSYDQAQILTSSACAHLTASAAGMPCTAFAYMSVMMYLVTTSAAARLGRPA